MWLLFILLFLALFLQENLWSLSTVTCVKNAKIIEDGGKLSLSTFVMSFVGGSFALIGLNVVVLFVLFRIFFSFVKRSWRKTVEKVIYRNKSG